MFALGTSQDMARGRSVALFSFLQFCFFHFITATATQINEALKQLLDKTTVPLLNFSIL